MTDSDFEKRALEQWSYSEMERWRGETPQHDLVYPWVAYRAGLLAGARFGRQVGWDECVEMLRSEQARLNNPTSMERPNEIWTQDGWATWLASRRPGK